MMQMKQLTTTFAAAGLAMAMAATPAQANEDTAKAIAGIIALGLLGAAIAEDQSNSSHPDYKPHPRVDPNENAVGACVHRATRKVKKAGGSRLKLNKVNSVVAGSDGKTSVSIRVTGYYPALNKTSDVVCVVKNNKVVSYVNN